MIKWLLVIKCYCFKDKFAGGYNHQSLVPIVFICYLVHFKRHPGRLSEKWHPDLVHWMETIVYEEKKSTFVTLWTCYWFESISICWQHKRIDIDTQTDNFISFVDDIIDMRSGHCISLPIQHHLINLIISLIRFTPVLCWQVKI